MGTEKDAFKIEADLGNKKKQEETKKDLSSILEKLYKPETRKQALKLLDHYTREWANHNGYYMHGPTLSGKPPAKDRDDIIIEIKDIYGDVNTINLPTGEYPIITAKGKPLTMEQLSKVDLSKFLFKNKLIIKNREVDEDERLEDRQKEVKPNFTERYFLSEIYKIINPGKSLPEDYERKIWEEVDEPAPTEQRSLGWFLGLSGGSRRNRKDQNKKRSKRLTYKK